MKNQMFDKSADLGIENGKSGRAFTAVGTNFPFSIPPFRLRSPTKQAKPGSSRSQACLTLDQTDGAQGRRLLQFDGCAGCFEVLLELLGIFLRYGFLQDATGLGEVLGFLQA